MMSVNFLSGLLGGVKGAGFTGWGAQAVRLAAPWPGPSVQSNMGEASRKAFTRFAAIFVVLKSRSDCMSRNSGNFKQALHCIAAFRA
jgi:hypothetical protein